VTEHSSTQNYLQLPISVVGYIDIGRLTREMDDLAEFLNQAAIREPGTSMKLPKSSKLFDELVSANNLNMLQKEDRERLQAFLEEVKAKAPRLHISFGADPSPLFLQKLMDYLRGAVHPLVLVQIGLQPNIGAGCVLRSTNKIFDMSLREDFKQKRGLLMKHIANLKTPSETEATS